MQKTTHILITFTLIWLFALPLVASGQVTILSACEELSQGLIKGYAQKGIKLRGGTDPNLRLAIGIVVEASTKKRTHTSAEFESNLETLLWYGENFSIIERSELTQLLKEFDFQMSDLVNPESVKRLGKIKGVDALMIGNYTVEPAALTLRCRIVAVETGVQLSSGIKRIPFEQLHLERREALKQQAKTPLPEHQQNEPNVGAFRLDFWYETLDASGKTIRQPIGQKVKSDEQVNIVAETDVDAYVYAFTIDADYEVFPFFATAAGNPIKLKAGEPRRIEGSVNGTLGTERFYAIAHTENFALTKIQLIIEKELAYLKSQKNQKTWRPLRTRNLLLPDEPDGRPNRFVQANFWFEHVQR